MRIFQVQRSTAFMENTKENMTRLGVVSPDPQSQTGTHLWIPPGEC